MSGLPAPAAAARQFLGALGFGEQAELWAFAADAVQPVPQALRPWRCGRVALGWLTDARAQWLAAALPGCAWTGQELVWQAQDWRAPERSEALQSALLAAREQGLLSGWRNERFSFWHSACAEPLLHAEPLFSVERAGFRFLGMQSHAVHVNGFLADGRLWCGQRALCKATDPGMLDNLAAGGLPSGEDAGTCLQRELAEEAGLLDLAGSPVQAAGTVRTARLEPQGWHDEYVQVYNLLLGDGFEPANQDGEVAAFHCLDAPAVLARMRQGAFTADAVQTLLQGLRAALRAD